MFCRNILCFFNGYSLEDTNIYDTNEFSFAVDFIIRSSVLVLSKKRDLIHIWGNDPFFYQGKPRLYLLTLMCSTSFIVFLAFLPQVPFYFTYYCFHVLKHVISYYVGSNWVSVSGECVSCRYCTHFTFILRNYYLHQTSPCGSSVHKCKS